MVNNPSMFNQATFSNFIPSDEMSVTDKREMKNMAMKAGMTRALFKGFGSNPAELAVREIRPSIDLPTAFAAGDRWIFPATPGAVAAFTTTVWINERVPVNTILVFYGVALESANPQISEILFRSGPNGAGRTAGVFNVESCYTKMESDGYLSMPITYDDQETIYVQVINRIAVPAAGTIVTLRGYAIEPRRQQVS
jgi:hypothetical protein